MIVKTVTIRKTFDIIVKVALETKSHGFVFLVIRRKKYVFLFHVFGIWVVYI
jgi:hypothetical protein